jgi:hypothetical protein
MNYTTGLRNLHEETATWFLQGDIFNEWHSAGSLLWVHGKRTFMQTRPLLVSHGSCIRSWFGEEHPLVCHCYFLSLHASLTVLTSSAIIQHVVSLSKCGRASLAYFYFDFQDDNKKHRHNLLPSLLVQFAARSAICCSIISRLHSDHEDGREQPNDENLMKCLTDMLSASPQHPMYIIMDALDECPNSSGVRSPRGHVLSFVQELLELRLRNLHICVTSRPEIDIQNRLEPLTSLRISLEDQTGHKEDIAKYIESEVCVIANEKRWQEDDQILVIETLSEKADGM